MIDDLNRFSRGEARTKRAIHPLDLVPIDWVTARQYISLDGLTIEVGVQIWAMYASLLLIAVIRSRGW